MAKHKIEFDEECKSCNGTGLYSGMGESPECAVVCHTCKGTGCHHFIYEYNDFTSRKNKPKIKHVYEVNPGIKVGNSRGYNFNDFGGMPYKDWKSGMPFELGMENRKFTCPAWWYQTADYKKKPEWDECFDSLGSSFSKCPHFSTKSRCWERWDKEFKQKGGK